MNTVFAILAWVQDHNLNEELHFPVIGVSHGYLAMIKSLMKGGITHFKPVPKI